MQFYAKHQLRNKDVRIKSESKKQKTDQSTPEVHLGEQQREIICMLVCCVSLTRLSALGWTRMVGRVFTCMFGARPRGHSITACPTSPLCPFPVLWGRHHSAGVSGNLIQEALQGVFGWGERRWRNYP